MLMDSSSQQGWRLGDECVDSTLLTQWVLVLVVLLFPSVLQCRSSNCLLPSLPEGGIAWRQH